MTRIEAIEAICKQAKGPITVLGVGKVLIVNDVGQNKSYKYDGNKCELTVKTGE